MSADVEPVEYEVLDAVTPCCGCAVKLRLETFVRYGRPRRTDTSVTAWNLRCDSCGAWSCAIAEVRYRVRQEFGSYVTRRRAAGAVVWVDRP